jgi:hypothetical protein
MPSPFVNLGRRFRFKPHWNKGKRLLTWRGIVVKEFTRPAPSQELILDAFEEQGWPPCIDDPLTGIPGKNRKTRLRTAIERLNGCQKNRLLHFGGNGLGTGICWRPIKG